jgi:hypothetical protein
VFDVEAAPIPHTLPWYFGVLIVAFWVAVVVAAVAIIRYRRRNRDDGLPELIGIGIGPGDGGEEGRGEGDAG